jgi:hypothetical protein
MFLFEGIIMARTVDHIERISESFDSLDEQTKVDLSWELLMRLPEKDKIEFLRRLQFGAKLAGLIGGKKKRAIEDGAISETLQGMEPLGGREPLP